MLPEDFKDDIIALWEDGTPVTFTELAPTSSTEKIYFTINFKPYDQPWNWRIQNDFLRWIQSQLYFIKKWVKRTFYRMRSRWHGKDSR